VITLKHLRLQSQFFLYFSGLALFVLLSVSGAIFYFQRLTLQKQAQDKAFSLTRTLAYSSLNAILIDDYIVLQMLIDSIIDGPDVRSIALLDTSGNIIASSNPELRGHRQTDALTQRALSSPTLLLQKIEDEAENEIWDTAVPIYELDRRVGTARMKYSVEDTYSGLLFTISAIGIITLAISLGLAYRLALTISRPIHSAVQLAHEYGSGNLDATLTINRSDEIGDLVGSLNKLSHELRSMIDEKISNESMIMLGEFASYIIHDLKNPVNGIHLLSDGLHRRTPEDSPLKKYSTEILLASQKLQDFIARTLDIARWSQVNFQPVKLDALIDETIQEISSLTAPIIKMYDGAMPEFKADHQLLVMAVKNLLINAMEAIDGPGTITIETHWGEMVSIKISDTGKGITEANLKTIFRPFFSMKAQGHGLGLAMVKKAVIMHQGKIEVESKVGVGSTFTITIPGNLS
jgi:signal transduction histidine kinase